ncbi:tyrosine-type recombinase/integrase [Ideonella sp.]|uniref:tyrosine-type recombinase/integrase n=1 Tax=Ideonella sp. TaxID=1929293 RepID=UPI0035B22744
MQFDARKAKALKPSDHLTLEGAPGLRLEATETRRAWIYRFKSPADGRMRQVKLGQWPAMSLAAALGAWEAMRAVRDAGRDPAQEKRAAAHAERAKLASGRADGAALTVQRLCEDFIERFVAARRTPKGVAELRALFARRVYGLPLARRPAASVTRADAYDLISSAAGTPVEAGNLRRELGAAWDYGHDSGRLGDEVPNWWRLVLRGKLASKGKLVGRKVVDGKPTGGAHQGVQKVALRPGQVGEVLRHLPHVSRQTAELLTLYLWTGCRGAEIVAIEGREVAQEADGWWWTIPRRKLKMGKHPLATDLRVPLIGRALEVVRARIDRHGAGYLYPPARGKAPHVDQSVVSVAVWYHMPGCTLRPEAERARWPVEGWTPHDLRRTVRTQLTALGCRDDVAEAVLGHLQAGVSGVYNRHAYDAERREWLTRIDRAWEAAAERA